ncbi:hypothetical protein ACROYT_G029203 [Oculina patagonica]
MVNISTVWGPVLGHFVFNAFFHTPVESKEKGGKPQETNLWSKSRLLLHTYLFCYSSRLLHKPLREVNNPRRGCKISLRLLKHLKESRDDPLL